MWFVSIHPNKGWQSVYGLELGMAVYMGHPVLPVCVRCFLPDIWYGRSSATGDSSRRDPGHNGPAHLKVPMIHPEVPLDKSQLLYTYSTSTQFDSLANSDKRMESFEAYS